VLESQALFIFPFFAAYNSLGISAILVQLRVGLTLAHQIVIFGELKQSRLRKFGNPQAYFHSNIKKILMD
jgi:hypothetical protein